MRVAPFRVERIDAPNGPEQSLAAKSRYGVNGEIARPHPEKAGNKRLPLRRSPFTVRRGTLIDLSLIHPSYAVFRPRKARANENVPNAFPG
jgi:type IV secretory pathway VirB10-like protein